MKFRAGIDIDEVILTDIIDCLIGEDAENYYFFNNGDRMGIGKQTRVITNDFVTESFADSRIRMKFNTWFVKGYIIQ